MNSHIILIPFLHYRSRSNVKEVYRINKCLFISVHHLFGRKAANLDSLWSLFVYLLAQPVQLESGSFEILFDLCFRSFDSSIKALLSNSLGFKTRMKDRRAFNKLRFSDFFFSSVVLLLAFFQHRSQNLFNPIQHLSLMNFKAGKNFFLI